MNPFMKSFLAVFGAALIVICFVRVSSADLPASDVTEINQYKLSDKTLVQFFQATKNLVPIVQKARRLSDSEDSDDSDEQENLSRLVEQFEAIPGAKKAVNDAGMTIRDYLKFQFALVYAASGQAILKAGAKLPDEYSKDNVEFFRAHEAEFQQHQNDFEIVRNFTKEEDGNDDEDDDDD